MLAGVMHPHASRLPVRLRPAALALVLAACGEPDGGGAGSSEGEASAGASTGAGTTATSTTTAASVDGSGSTDGGAGSSEGDTGAPVECPDGALGPGTHPAIMIEHGGAMRSYDLHVPPGADGATALPLVLNFHGYLGFASQQAGWSGMSQTADLRGFAVAYPQGLDNSWNGGACCGTSASSGTDDVGFARAVVADIATKLCVDPRRVYATGMSNGGFLSHRLACEASDLFAAVGPVAGVLGIPFETCAPGRRVPVIHFHGTADTLVPYDGNGLDYPSVADTIARWAEIDGCAGAAVEDFAMDDVHCEIHADCEDGTAVRLCTVEGGGHCWPGNPECAVFGTSTTTISANDEMWAFFEQHTLP
jgi:polyhydroxybutyrate depolymerase